MTVPDRVAPFLAAAHKLVSHVNEARGEIERQRNLPPALVAEMTEAGMFSIWLCRACGGPELDFVGFLRVIEELSRADGSVGWCAMIAAGLGWLSGYMTADAALQIFGDGRRCAGTLSPTGKAIAVEGGFRVSGRWSFASFIAHSDWVAGNSIVHDSDVPRRDTNGAPDIRLMIMPTSEVEIIDNWHVSGLRGSGSSDYQVHDMFVPAEHSLAVFQAQPLQPGPLYRMPLITLFAATVPCVSVGIARAAIDAFLDLAENKTPTGSTARLREGPVAQADVGRAEARLRAGRAFLVEAMEELWAEAVAGRTPTLRQRAIARLAAAEAAESSVRTVELVWKAAGATALFESNRLERCFRDVHATTQHILTNTGNFEVAGRVLLGLEPGRPNF
jgi:alkylation response protein AidB-like acyl-CoA dehydrogenase